MFLSADLNTIEETRTARWFTSAWFLERKHPERRGKREVLPADDRERDEVGVIG